jgi:hypothetical protein
LLQIVTVFSLANRSAAFQQLQAWAGVTTDCTTSWRIGRTLTNVRSALAPHCYIFRIDMAPRAAAPREKAPPQGTPGACTSGLA